MKKSSTELKSLARTTLAGRYGTPLGAFVFATLIPSILILPFYYFSTNESLLSNIIYFIALILIGIISALLMAGITQLHLNMVRKLPYQFSDLFVPFNLHPQRFIGASILLSFITFLCAIPYILLLVLWIMSETAILLLLTILGLILFLILSVIISLRYAFVFHLLLDYPNMSVLSAFKESSTLMIGNKGRLFYLIISFLGFMLLGICSCYIGFLWIAPYTTSTMAHFYLDLTTNSTPSNENYSEDRSLLL